MNSHNNRLVIDVGSTYFKLGVITEHGCEQLQQHFRNFNSSVHDDLMHKCGAVISSFAPENVHICSSANGGLSTLIIGLTHTFSLKYATNIAFNSGINIIDTILYQDIEAASIPSDLIDVVIIVGGINSRPRVFDDKLISYLSKISYSNIVYVGNQQDGTQVAQSIPSMTLLPNIIDERLQIVEAHLKDYLTNLYQQDIEGKEDIKDLYAITSNQIFSTPYVVNQTLSLVDASFSVVNPFLLIDIGGATTDIHYAKDLVDDNLVTENEFDRLVFKKLGVYKSRESLIFDARHNEFVGELLMHLHVTEHIFTEHSDKATRILMLLALFLVLCKMSQFQENYVTLNLHLVNSILLTGGVTKVFEQTDVDDIIAFFYRKILTSAHRPAVILDNDYTVWTLGHRPQPSQ